MKGRGKRYIVGLLLTGLAISTIFLGGHTQQEERFLRNSREFVIQGLIWRTIAYYYHSGIYGEIYNAESNLRLVTKAMNVGANYLLVRAFYSCTEDGELIGDDAEAERYLRAAMTTAHDFGIKIFLTPYVESADFWPERRCQLSEGTWTEAVLHWAAFAQENNIELFAPGFEMSLIMDADEAGEWLKGILPAIREIYSGKITTAEHPYIGRWEVLERHNAFAGYDCIGMTVFPWKEYDGEIDMRSFEDYRNDVRERAEIINYLGDKYGIDCRLVATLGMDLWQGQEPTPTIRAQAYEIGLDVLEEFGLTGVFLHIWASESDHLGDSEEVEEMLRRRWTGEPAPFTLGGEGVANRD